MQHTQKKLIYTVTAFAASNECSLVIKVLFINVIFRCIILQSNVEWALLTDLVANSECKNAQDARM
jgi:hypothetical protein